MALRAGLAARGWKGDRRRVSGSGFRKPRFVDIVFGVWMAGIIIWMPIAHDWFRGSLSAADLHWWRLIPTTIAGVVAWAFISRNLIFGRSGGSSG